MKKTLPLILFISAFSTGCATHNSHWSYSGNEKPENWAKLSSDYHACAGKNQSPINVTGSIQAELLPIKFDYKKGGNEIINNGHTIQINYEKGSRIYVDGQAFNLLQFHFHAPSENHINGKSYPLEAHFVHANSNNELAVIAVMYESGAKNAAFKEAWNAMPKTKNKKNKLPDLMSASKFLPQNKDYYRFNGSLTTPPCSEGVRWLVMKETQTASKQQITFFSNALHEPNNRPIQPLNARTILK